MARLEMRADEQDDFCICMIGAGAVETHPQLITFATARGTDVSVRVVPVNPPGCEYVFGKTILTRTPDVIHDLVTPVLEDGSTNPRRNFIKRRIPCCAF